MMMNIFSIFDPSTPPMLSNNWLSPLIMFLILPYQFWLTPSRNIMMWNMLFKYVSKELKSLLTHTYINLIGFISLLIMIFFNNFLGLFPYIFTAPSHLSFSLSLSLTMWMGMMMFSLFMFFNDTMSHLTPQGTPIILMPFMVIIESISLMIRPFTLAIRLSANMIAGHLLLTLLGTPGPSLSMLLLPILIFSQILLLILEISVSIIQAYVFSTLSTLYSSEI